MHSIAARHHLAIVASVVDEKVPKGVDGVVVEAVFLRQLTGSMSGFRVVVTFHCLNQAGASRRNYQTAFTIAGANRPAYQFDALQDAAPFESKSDS